MKAGLTLTQLAQEIERQAAAKQDFIAPASQVSVTVVEGKPNLKVGSQSYALGKVANDQLAEYAGIPTAYFRRMATEAPELLATNVNRWMQDKAAAKDRRMVRTLDGKARAFLSDKYRPLDNEELGNAILPMLLERNMMVMSSQITETRLYIKAVDRKILKDVPTGRKIGDGSHVFFDTLSPAITISNSEVGNGALSIEQGIYTKVCTNLATFGTNFRKFHTGSRADISDEVYALLTDQTKRVSDAAVWGQVRDILTATFDEGRFNALADKLQEATEDKLPAMQVEEVIEVVGKRLNFNEGERKGILGALIEGGDLTRYGVHSAVTRFSQDVADYDRASELERAGGRIIELPRNQWQEILKQAA